MIKKGLVFGIIVLFIGVGFTGSTYSLSMNRSQMSTIESNESLSISLVDRDLIVTLVTDKEKYDIGEPIEVTIYVINTGEEDITLIFPTTQKADFWINEREVYQWSADKVFLQIFTPVTFPSGETVELFSKNWEQVDYGGNQVPEGEYRIEGWMVESINTSPIFGNPVTISIENHPPNAPTIKGKRVIWEPGTYDYKFKAIDQDGDDVKYLIDWGDGPDKEWTDYYASGEEITVSHTWDKICVVKLRARANDTHGALGPWGTLTVTIPVEISQSVNQQMSQQSTTMDSRSQNIMSVVSSETQHWEYGSEDDNEAEAPITTMLWPPDVAAVCGYLTDELTHEPIVNARVRLIWDREYINSTFTDDSGFFYMNSPKGYIHLWPTKIGYKDDWWIKIGFIEDNETIWKNLSLIPFPPYNSTICGYVTDGMTNEPIEDVQCTYYWYYYGDPIVWHAGTDINGFYEFNVPATEESWSINFKADNYYDNWTYGSCIMENETIWGNVSLYGTPPRNSVVCGYIKDFGTHEPIPGVNIYIEWRNEHGYEYYQTITNIDGFFSINVPTGEILGEICREGYRSGYFYIENIEENEIVWVNSSLIKPRCKIAPNILLNWLERFPLLERFQSLLIK